MTCTHPNVIGIYVAEEQELYQHWYPSIFETECKFKLVGISSACHRQSFNNYLTSEEIDILLVGTHQFNADLLHELEYALSIYPRISLVILVTCIDTDAVSLFRNLLQKCGNGIAIYLKQSLDNTKQLLDLIFSVSQGQVILDPAVAKSLLAEKAECSLMKEFTEREAEILRLLSQGYTNQGIAQILFIDSKTVAHHINNIYSKLKDDGIFNKKHLRVSTARLYMENTGELRPYTIENSVSPYPNRK